MVVRRGLVSLAFGFTGPSLVFGSRIFWDQASLFAGYGFCALILAAT